MNIVDLTIDAGLRALYGPEFFPRHYKFQAPATRAVDAVP
jgi:hypothetical protein